MAEARTFTEEQVLNILVCWQQTLTPEDFPESKQLSPEDFLDAVTCQAQELELEKEFDEALKKAGFQWSEEVPDSDI